MLIGLFPSQQCYQISISLLFNNVKRLAGCAGCWACWLLLGRGQCSSNSGVSLKSYMIAKKKKRKEKNQSDQRKAGDYALLVMLAVRKGVLIKPVLRIFMLFRLFRATGDRCEVRSCSYKWNRSFVVRKLGDRRGRGERALKHPLHSLYGKSTQFPIRNKEWTSEVIQRQKGSNSVNNLN